MNKVATVENERAISVANQLEQLRAFTIVVADSSDFSAIQRYRPRDATTNPSLILKAAQMTEYASILRRAMADHRATGPRDLGATVEEILVLFGLELLKVVPGRVSTETHARLSFDTAGLIENAHRLIGLYERNGIDRDRVLIKIATTWEGIKAMEQLQREGINCNMTLLFSLAQAAACAEAGAKLISPFVGRILDWHKARTGKDYPAHEDPGVVSVREIYTYYKQLGYRTEVMGASFRNKSEILELAGCDLLTISPGLLAELEQSREPVSRQLAPSTPGATRPDRLRLDEKSFRWMLNENAMASEKLAEGIRLFHMDAVRLEEYLQAIAS